MCALPKLYSFNASPDPTQVLRSGQLTLNKKSKWCVLDESPCSTDNLSPQPRHASRSRSPGSNRCVLHEGAFSVYDKKVRCKPHLRCDLRGPHPLCAPHPLSVHSVPRAHSVLVPAPHPLCARSSFSLHPLCALSAPSLHPLCIISAPSLHPLRQGDAEGKKAARYAVELAKCPKVACSDIKSFTIVLASAPPKGGKAAKPGETLVFSAEDSGELIGWANDLTAVWKVRLLTRCQTPSLALNPHPTLDGVRMIGAGGARALIDAAKARGV